MNIENYSHLFESCHLSTDTGWKNKVKSLLEDFFAKPSHGHFNNWMASINNLSALSTSHCMFDRPVIEIGLPEENNIAGEKDITQIFKTLGPWRKGPFRFFGTYIDSEWRCDQKWQRIQNISPNLKNKSILDVGCGNGYYMLRMLGDGAKSVVGVDPTAIFLAQHFALTQNIDDRLPAHLLPITFEQLPGELNEFDIAFSMGVLYHRRNPLEHLNNLFSAIAPGGELILETLVITSNDNSVLIPEKRYAGMRNVWSLPSIDALKTWLSRAGFVNTQWHHSKSTQPDEQRSTAWTKNHSLDNFLDPCDPTRTIEGYPAPVRSILSARKP